MRKIAIACLNKNLAIGFKNDLIFNIPSEFKLFKKNTKSTNLEKPNVVLMGRKTFESIGNKPLPNRFNCVISRNDTNLESMYRYPNLKFFNSIDDCISHFDNIKHNYGDMYICGGTSIYKHFIKNNLLDLAYITYIRNPNQELGDTFFPNHSIIENYMVIHKELFTDKDATIINTGEKIKVDYEFVIYYNNFNTDSDLYTKISKNILGELEHYKDIVRVSDEQCYLNAISDVLQWGKARQSRNAVVLSKFGKNMEFDISENFPLLTTKKVFWKGVLHELLWFLKGDTNSKHLSDNGVRIWDGNTTREYLDSINLKEYKEGECGPIYGYQWRHFNAPYKGCDNDYKNSGVDQLNKIVELIKNDPSSRRMFMSAWNPEQLPEMCLPPCHVSYQFYVDIDPTTKIKYLSCSMYQRSGDMFLGVPFNIASTAALTYILADLTNCKPQKITINIGDAHIYKDHLDAVSEQLSRIPYAFPKLTINGKHNSLEDYKYDDFVIEGYNSHPTIKAKMIA